jgi:YbbR domain-containing protein
MSSRFLTSNLSLKIISVIAAIILWLYAVSELNPETTKTINDIPVEIINMDALNEKNLTLAEDPASSISIRIRGLVNDIRKVNTSNIKAILDLGEIDWTGTNTVPLNVEGLLPREVKLDKIPEIPVTINRITSKLVPVVVELTGKSEDGYYVHEPIVEPRQITIYGAESLVDSVVQGVVRINLDKDVSTIEQSLMIKLVDGEGNIIESKYLNMKQSSALVTIPIYPLKTVDVRANIIGEPAEGFVIDKISVNPPQVSVNGFASIIERLSYLTTEAIDIQGAVGNIEKKVDIVLDNGIYLVPGQPSSVNIIVNISETTIETTLTLDQVELQNVPEGYEAELDNPPITVQLRGPYTKVNTLNPQNLSPAVDLSELITEDGVLEPGQYELPLKINVPDQIELVQISHERVKVNVSSVDSSINTGELAE